MKVTNHKNQTWGITFAHGFDGIADTKVGLDGYLYILSLDAGVMIADLFIHQEIYVYHTKLLNGSIFRIVPRY
jgi:hypothetical protein